MASELKIGSDRSFGLIFAVVFMVIGLWPFASGGAVRDWAIITAALFFLLAWIAPKLLHPLNKFWCLLGVYLGRITSPIVIFLMYFCIVTPSGILVRAFGKDLLRQNPQPNTNSYWLKREEPISTMKRQF